jgi:hypothetical protein
MTKHLKCRLICQGLLMIFSYAASNELINCEWLMYALAARIDTISAKTLGGSLLSSDNGTSRTQTTATTYNYLYFKNITPISFHNIDSVQREFQKKWLLFTQFSSIETTMLFYDYSMSHFDRQLDWKGKQKKLLLADLSSVYHTSPYVYDQKLYDNKILEEQMTAPVKQFFIKTHPNW